ncbi:LysR family transcriptional regulator [Pseudomonas sp. SJZ103]|uniref:LysR family transcriptional regulator n=1 Tax=unclassified Pseudomonas TaxID=196821 RepID=UPI0011A71813|nr:MULTISPECIES: LysR family transcriptional regulator [unclassified Pseudomonas]TWC63147.1 LysR family transcriptional regulator [Pseudomonas sp. SJZ103]TWC80164.1 LysR family transcriptional regulator [Pseudomonas sp. SJZ094]
MDRWTEYELFVKVTELGSLNKAAEALGLSNAAASRHLAALENRLGARLIERSTRRLFVTEIGKDFYNNSKAALLAMQGATDAVSATKSHPTGVLRVTASLSLCLQHILPLLPNFNQQYPDVRLDIVAENRYYDIIDDNIDVALRTRESEPDTSLVIRRLTETRRTLAASPDYLQRRGCPEHPKALVNHQLLLYTYATAPYEMVFRREEESITITTKASLESNDGQLLRAAALQGLGILAQPTYVIHNDIVAGRLVPVLADWSLPRLAINLVYTSRQHLPAKTRAFIDFIVKEFKHLD